MVVLFGAAPDTGNEGVSALCRSAVAGLSARGVDPIWVADHGRGARAETWTLNGREVVVRRVGLTHNRRVWREDCLRTVGTLLRLGGLGNAAANAVRGSRCVLDVSGGDSFTDIYGARRFQAMRLTKRLALDNGKSLILLPQTLGPFRDPARRREAASILRGADAIWVRDAESMALLRDCLGDAFDPERHHAGVDMAVRLPAVRPSQPLPKPFDAWLGGAEARPVAGLNVSGLLCNGAAAAADAFGLRADHPSAVEAIARAILADEPCVRLALIPHVIRQPGHPESDWAAARALEARLSADFPGRVATLPNGFNASELKWIIARLDWFAGARMHATIAAFSSGVPTLGLGYSDKAKGVFVACGVPAGVADLRRLDADAVGAAALASFRGRADERAALTRLLPGLFARAEAQMDAIATAAMRPACAAAAA